MAWHMSMQKMGGWAQLEGDPSTTAPTSGSLPLPSPQLPACQLCRLHAGPTCWRAL